MSVSIAKLFVRTALGALTHAWAPYSRLFLASDSDVWAISWEMREVGAIARQLGHRLGPVRLLPFADSQSAFFGSHFNLLLSPRWFETRHRLATAYFHGRPGTGTPEFDACHANLKKHHERVERIQVSHSAMRDVVLETGIDPAKVFLIPIGINPKFFTPQTAGLKSRARHRFGISGDAFVVGSFQKDGVGWGEGMVPKLIKGPDSFVRTMALLKERIPQLFVLLSGPARGYVKQELTRRGIAHHHLLLKDYRDIAKMYQALDVYVVASREEGGPKSILESMASGVPLVTTRVGQAMDLVRHAVNGWMVDVEDVEGLAYYAERVHQRAAGIDGVIEEGIRTASANAYERQTQIWGQFFEGFVR